MLLPLLQLHRLEYGIILCTSMNENLPILSILPLYLCDLYARSSFPSLLCSWSKFYSCNISKSVILSLYANNNSGPCKHLQTSYTKLKHIRTRCAGCSYSVLSDLYNSFLYQVSKLHLLLSQMIQYGLYHLCCY